jgi:hypothetical protein
VFLVRSGNTVLLMNTIHKHNYYSLRDTFPSIYRVNDNKPSIALLRKIEITQRAQRILWSFEYKDRPPINFIHIDNNHFVGLSPNNEEVTPK